MSDFAKSGLSTLNVMKLQSAPGPFSTLTPFVFKAFAYPSRPVSLDTPMQPPDLGKDPSAIAAPQTCELGLWIPLPMTIGSFWHRGGQIAYIYS